MIVTIHQPDFLPWRGYFERMHQADLLVVLDDAQFLRRGWHHRDRIKTISGPRWLTVPTLRKGKFKQHIRDVSIDNSTNWRKKHLGLIRSSYGTAPHFQTIFPELTTIYQHKHESLMELCMAGINWAANRLGIITDHLFSSELETKGTGTDRLVEICTKVGAEVYLTGTGSRDYLKEALFTEAGLTVRWQDEDLPEYPQLHGAFEPNLSILDYLMMQKKR